MLHVMIFKVFLFKIFLCILFTKRNLTFSKLFKHVQLNFCISFFKHHIVINEDFILNVIMSTHNSDQSFRQIWDDKSNESFDTPAN